MNSSKIFILGAGITGLSIAFYLKKNGFEDFIILESSNKAGGKINTIHDNGLIIEQGADSMVISKKEGLELIRELGMDSEIIYPKTRVFSFLSENGLIAPPQNIQNLVPQNEQDILNYPYFSETGKQEILNESQVMPNFRNEDESFHNFISRRFGLDYLENYAGPLFQGIYGTAVENMSLLATFPQFRKMEREFGSLTSWSKSLNEVGFQNESRSPFIGLRNGMDSFVKKIVDFIGEDKIRFNSKVKKITSINQNFELNIENETIITKSLFVTLHPNTLFQLLGKDNIHQKLNLSSSKVITLQYNKRDIESLPNSTGFISLKNYKGIISASTWTSKKWENRDHNETELYRFFVKDTNQIKNDNLPELVESEFSKLFNIENKAINSWVFSWLDAMPMYEIHHLKKVEEIRSSLTTENKHLLLGGCALEGVGIPDCIKQGKEMALKYLSSI